MEPDIVDVELERDRVRESKVARVCSWIAYALCLAWTIFLVPLINLGAGALRPVFKDFGATLPVLTRIVMHPGYSGLILVLAAVGLIKEVSMSNRIATLVWNGVHLVLLMVLFWLSAFALLAPLYSLIMTLNR